MYSEKDKRTYKQVVRRLAQQKYSHYMGGAMIARYDGSGIVCYIYGVTNSRLSRDVDVEYKLLFKR